MIEFKVIFFLQNAFGFLLKLRSPLIRSITYKYTFNKFIQNISTQRARICHLLKIYVFVSEKHKETTTTVKAGSQINVFCISSLPLLSDKLVYLCIVRYLFAGSRFACHHRVVQCVCVCAHFEIATKCQCSI